MPTFEPRPLATAVLTCGLLLSGCADGDGNARAEAEAELTRLARQLQLVATSAVASGDADAPLTKVARDAAAIAAGNATAAQKESAHRLAAAAQQQLAELAHARGVEAASASARARDAAEAQILAAARLASLAEAVAAVDGRAARAMVEAEISATEDAVREASQAVAELDGPIADLRSANETDLREAGRLNREANDLRADARAVGYAAGLPNYRRAIELEREADEYEFRVASRQNELSSQLEPASRLEQSRISSRQAAVEQLRTTLASFGDRETQMEAAARATRDAIGSLRGDLERLLADAAPSRAGEHFQSAADAADRAASAAQRAASAGRDTRIRAQLLHGQALAGLVAEHRAQARVLRAASGVPALGIDAGQVDELERQANDAAQQAETILAEVVAAAEGSDALAALGRTAQQARARLAGD